MIILGRDKVPILSQGVVEGNHSPRGTENRAGFEEERPVSWAFWDTLEVYGEQGAERPSEQHDQKPGQSVCVLREG